MIRHTLFFSSRFTRTTPKHQPEPFVKTNRKRLKRKNEEKSTRNALAAHRRRWSALLTDLDSTSSSRRRSNIFFLWTIRREFLFLWREIMSDHNWCTAIESTYWISLDTFALLERERTECSHEKCPSFVIDSCAIHTAIVRSCAHHLTWKVISIVRSVFAWSLWREKWKKHKAAVTQRKNYDNEVRWKWWKLDAIGKSQGGKISLSRDRSHVHHAVRCVYEHAPVSRWVGWNENRKFYLRLEGSSRVDEKWV